VAAEATGLVWRLGSDISFIAYQKKPTPVCEFLKFLAQDHGLATVDIENHVVTPKYHAVAAAWDFCLAISVFFCFGLKLHGFIVPLEFVLLQCAV